MAKFSSLDGIDKNGIRAEVTVQTGTGKIKEIIGRGKQNDDGSYRNVEIVFDPDNPLLKRKVYGLLDTNAAELWAYIQQALDDQRTVSYRIESQRRNGVDRATPIGDLNATEQVRRILASVDGVFSHEAKTNPAEDPSDENPSALAQALSPTPATQASGTASTVSVDTVLAGLSMARQAGMSDVVVDTLIAQAMAAGATLEQVQTAGVSLNEPESIPRPIAAAFASEEKPWLSWNSDGRINYGSYAVTRAAEAEQFALDHLIELYTPAKSKSTIDVSDEVIAQAASLGLQLLQLADQVQVAAYGGGKPDRMKNSYARALNLVMDAVGKRYPAPVGGSAEEQSAWGIRIVEEASERLYGLGEIAHGNIPKSQAEREGAVEPPPAPKAAEGGVADAMELLGAQNVASFPASEFVTGKFPLEGENGFIAPAADSVAKLRELCEAAGVLENPKEVSDWLERVTGVRSARKIHQATLDALCQHYLEVGAATVRAEVLGTQPA